MAGGEKGNGARVTRGYPEFNGTVGGQHQSDLLSPGEKGTSPGEGPGQRHQGRREGSGAQGAEPQTLFREGHTHHRKNQMCGMSSLQLNNSQCLQVLWPEPAPGAFLPQTCPPGVPGTGPQQPGCTLFIFSCLIWLILRQCCKNWHGKDKNKALMTQKADRLEHILATLPESDPLREDFQSQLDQLRNDLRDPRQAGARLDSANNCHCQATQGGSQGPKMQGGPPPVERGFAICPRREGGPAHKLMILLLFALVVLAGERRRR